MVTFKKALPVALASLLAFGVVGTACGEETPEYVTYTFNLSTTDEYVSVAGAQVVLSENGNVVKTMFVDSTGVVVFSGVEAKNYEVSVKNLPLGYGSVPMQTGLKDATYSLSIEYTAKTPTLQNPGTPGSAGTMYNRYNIEEGSYVLSFYDDEEQFYNFIPERVGTYRVYSTGEIDVQLKSYNASPATCYPNPAKDVDDISAENKNFAMQFQIEEKYLYREEWVKDMDGDETPSAGDIFEKVLNESCYETFSISLSDKFTPSEYPVQCMITVEFLTEEVQDTGAEYDFVTLDTEETLTKFADYTGKYLTPVPYNAEFVYNETDRFYHLNEKDGPVIVLPYTTAPERLIDCPFHEVNDQMAAALYMTFTNEDGSKTVKDYTKLIEETYPAFVNGDGVYGLTKEMYEFIYHYVVVHNNDVNVTGVAKELRWKAPCYYYADSKPTGGAAGSANAPITIGAGEHTADFKAENGIVYYSYSPNKDGTLTVSTDSTNAYLNVRILSGNEGTEAAILEGVGTESFNFTKGSTLSLQVSTKDFSDGKVSFRIIFSEKSDTAAGSAANPIQATTGENDATIAVVNSIPRGVWYSFTPSQSGTYKFYCPTSQTASYGLYASANLGTDAITNSFQEAFSGYGYSYCEASLTAGTTYYLYVNTSGSETEIFTFKIEKTK